MAVIELRRGIIQFRIIPLLKITMLGLPLIYLITYYQAVVQVI